MGGARNVVEITITMMAASSGRDKVPLTEPTPVKTSPTSLLGIIPTPMARRLISGCPKIVNPVITLPIIATIIKNAAMIQSFTILWYQKVENADIGFCPHTDK